MEDYKYPISPRCRIIHCLYNEIKKEAKTKEDLGEIINAFTLGINSCSHLKGDYSKDEELLLHGLNKVYSLEKIQKEFGCKIITFKDIDGLIENTVEH